MLCRQIHELHAGLYPNDFQPDDKASIRALLAKVIAGKDESIFIARVDGKGVGYIWFEELGSHDGTFAKRPRRLYVNHIGVDPAYRRKGIARRLMNRVTTEAGTRQITLDSWAANAGAHAFFESLGFEPLRILFRRHGSLER
ncbi:MAG: GNAT family N-acetyltransferase [Pseudomonadota bacterium]